MCWRNRARFCPSLDSPSWVFEIKGALKSTRDIEELILDLRDSSGDHFCDSYSLVSYFFPASKVRFPTMLPNSSLIQKLTAFCLIDDTCEEPPVFAKQLKWKPSPFGFVKQAPRLQIITNGICSGACSVLIHGLMEQGVNKIYRLGPPSTSPPLGTSGTPYSLSKLRLDLSRSPFRNDGDAPPPLLTRADLHFTLDRPFKLQHGGPVYLDNTFPGVTYLSSELLADPHQFWNRILEAN